MDNTDLSSENLVQKLVERKEELGYTNAVIAEISGVPESTVTKVFNGTNRSPTYDTISPISHALGVSLDTITVIEESAEKSDSTKQAEAKPRDDRFVNYVISSTEARIKNKEKWLNRLSIAVAALMVLLILWLIWDYTHLDRGFIRYTAQAQIVPNNDSVSLYIFTPQGGLK